MVISESGCAAAGCDAEHVNVHHIKAPSLDTTSMETLVHSIMCALCWLTGLHHLVLSHLHSLKLLKSLVLLMLYFTNAASGTPQGQSCQDCQRMLQ